MSTREELYEKIEALEKSFLQELAELKKELAELDEQGVEKSSLSTNQDGEIDPDQEYVMPLEKNIFHVNHLPSGVIITSIKKKDFQGGQLVIPSKIGNDKVVAILPGAFKNFQGFNDTQITSVIICKGVQVIKAETFSGCKEIEFVKMANTVTTIENRAFYACTELKTVTLPQSVTSVGEEAFYYCKKLGYIYIPASVVTVGRSALFVTKETMVYCGADKKPQGWDNNWFGVGINPMSVSGNIMWGM